MKMNFMKSVLAICAAIILCAMLFCGTLLFLALQKPSVALRPAESSPAAAMSGLRLDSRGVTLGAADIAAIAGAAIAGSTQNQEGLEALGPILTGGDFYKDTIRLAFASSWTLPAGTPFLAGRTVPLYLAVRLSITAGDKPLVRIKGASVGRLPVPEALIARALADGMPRSELPPGIEWTGSAFAVDLSRMRVGAVRAVSLSTDKDLVRLGVDIPPQAVKKAYAAISSGLRKSGPAIGKDAASSGPAAPMARTVGKIAPSLSDPDGAVATVEFMEGTATVRYAADGESLQCGIGDTVFRGAVIATGKDSSMELRLSDRSLIRLGDGTSLDLALVAASGRGKSALELLGGSVRVKVAKLGGREDYSIRAGSVTLGVRGTEFLFVLDADNTVMVAVAEGTVELVSTGGKTTVETGEEAAASADGVVGESVAMSGKNAKMLEAAPFETPFAVLDEPFEPDRLASLWGIVRPALAWWNGLDASERERLETVYGDSFNIEEIGRSLGIDQSGNLSD